ncbi:ArsR/SmtB family transcription factor [Streptomyces celluloflavus]
MPLLFDVLAGPSRRKSLDLLLERSDLADELTRRIGLSRSGTSEQLRVLREVGLTRVRGDAQAR